VPAYASSVPGNRSGAGVYATACAGCHGSGGGGRRTIVDARTGAVMIRCSAVVFGRPDLGMPDWRGTDGGRPLSEQDIADLVAWMTARRIPFPGQPYPVQPASGQSG
jgi:cytochrome c553